MPGRHKPRVDEPNRRPPRHDTNEAADDRAKVVEPASAPRAGAGAKLHAWIQKLKRK